MQPPQSIAPHKMTCRKLTLSCNAMHARAHSRRIRAVAVSICAILCGCTRAETLPRANVTGGTSPRKVYAIERSFLPVQQLRLSLHLPRKRTAPLTTVLVFHSAMGRTESVLDSCDRLAEQGFAAVALDFYDGHVAASRNEAISLRDVANSRVPVIRGLIEEAYRRLESDPRLRSNARFLLGWSFGAAWATTAAGFLPDVRGVVAYYGEAFSDNPSLDEKLTSPVLFVGAERDSAPSPDQLHALVGRLAAKGKVAQLLLVPGAHGFAERSHPGFDAGATALAWPNVIRFLEENAPRDERRSGAAMRFGDRCDEPNRKAEQQYGDYTALRAACRTDADCTIAHARCPLPCGVAVRRDAVRDVEGYAEDLVQKLFSRDACLCKYRCLFPSSAVCLNDVCAVPVRKPSQ